MSWWFISCLVLGELAKYDMLHEAIVHRCIKQVNSCMIENGKWFEPRSYISWWKLIVLVSKVPTRVTFLLTHWDSQLSSQYELYILSIAKEWTLFLWQQHWPEKTNLVWYLKPQWYTWILSTQQSFKGKKICKILKWTFIFLAAGQEKASNSGRRVWIHGVSLLPDEDCWS